MKYNVLLFFGLPLLSAHTTATATLHLDVEPPTPFHLSATSFRVAFIGLLIFWTRYLELIRPPAALAAGILC